MCYMPVSNAELARESGKRTRKAGGKKASGEAGSTATTETKASE